MQSQGEGSIDVSGALTRSVDPFRVEHKDVAELDKQIENCTLFASYWLRFFRFLLTFKVGNFDTNT